MRQLNFVKFGGGLQLWPWISRNRVAVGEMLRPLEAFNTPLQKLCG